MRELSGDRDGGQVSNLNRCDRGLELFVPFVLVCFLFVGLLVIEGIDNDLHAARGGNATDNLRAFDPGQVAAVRVP